MLFAVIVVIILMVEVKPVVITLRVMIVLVDIATIAIIHNRVCGNIFLAAVYGRIFSNEWLYIFRLHG